MTLNRSALAATALALLAVPAFAQSQGDMTLGIGFHQVAPKSDNGSLGGGTLDVSVGDGARPTFTFEYFIRDNIGIEVLAATPFSHAIEIDGLGRVGTTKHLPPVVSIQYHFTNGSAFTPFLGAGLNYTAFFSEDTEGALAGGDLKLDDSWGVALHAGVDYKLDEHGSIRTDVRWADIDTDVSLDGADLGTVEIDPVIFGFAYVYKF